MISPKVDLRGIRAHEMLKIILERDSELGAYLQEQVDKKSLQLDDHAVMKEAEAWLDQKALVHSYSQKSGHSTYFSD